MMDLDNVKKQILEIEDFDNVSAELMQQIEANDEYRMLYEQCRDLSKALGFAVPTPEKDGVSLHNAVMKRVKEGDIAPRYIHTSSFRFPFATAACLCVVLAVVLISKSGFLQSKMSDSAAPENMNLADFNGEAGENDSVYNYSAGDGGAEEQKIIARYDTVSEEEYIVVEDDTEAASGAEEAKTEAAYDAKALGGDTIEYPSKKGEAFSDNMQAEESATEKKKVADDAETTYEESEVEAESESVSGVSYEVRKRLEAARLLTGDADVITEKDIADLGKENYIAFFDSISEKDNFKELYTLESFRKYCENN